MTHTRTHTPAIYGTGRRCAAAVFAVAAFVLVGCGTTTDPAVPDGGIPPTSTPPAPPTVCTDRTDNVTGTDTCDVDAVLTAAATALYSYRPTEQTQRGVNIDAAVSLLNPTWVRDLGVSYTALAPVTGGQWDRWQADRSRVDAQAAVTADNRPADTDTLARRVVAVQQTVVDPQGTTVGKLAPIALYMSATRANPLSGWFVSGMTVR